MSRTYRRLLAVLIGAVAVTASQGCAAKKVNVLIIDGQNNHKWQASTPLIEEMLVKTGRFKVDVATTPDKKAPKDAWKKFNPNFSKYGVVLSNYTGQSWPDDVNKEFEKYMQDGGGLVFYHSAVFSFPKWNEWNNMMGMGWRRNDFGDRLFIDDSGKVVRVPKGKGPGGGHGPSHAFEVKVRKSEHPVMKNVPKNWMHVEDELYHGMRGPTQNMTILATAFSAKKGGGTGAHEPMVWTVPYGKGRVFVSLFGHDTHALKAADTATMLCRGAEWAATGEVTIPVIKTPSPTPTKAKQKTE